MRNYQALYLLFIYLFSFIRLCPAGDQQAQRKEVEQLIFGASQDKIFDVINLTPPTEEDGQTLPAFPQFNGEEQLPPSSLHSQGSPHPEFLIESGQPHNLQAPPKNFQWIAEGQYWGYNNPSAIPPVNHPPYSNDANHPSYDDGSCIPPFCIPAACSGGGIGPQLCPQRCVTQTCNVGCFPKCTGGSDCIQNVCMCDAFRRGLDCNLMNSLVCQ